MYYYGTDGTDGDANDVNRVTTIIKQDKTDPTAVWAPDATVLAAEADPNTVAEADYSYYQSGDQFGLPGDLKLVTCTQYINTVPSTTSDCYYYRYYTTDTYSNGTFIGGPHDLQIAILPEAYNSFSHSGILGNQNIPACYYYEYNSAHQVTQRQRLATVKPTSLHLLSIPRRLARPTQTPGHQNGRAGTRWRQHDDNLRQLPRRDASDQRRRSFDRPTP